MARELRIGTLKRNWPFSKGLVIESLLNAGASRKDAVTVARQLEARLHSDYGAKPVSPATLKKLMIKLARPVAGKQVAATANRQLPTFQEILLQDEQGLTRPFSRGLITRTLEDSGLESRDAHALALSLERALRGVGNKTVSQSDLETQLETLLTQLNNEQALKNYHFLRQNRGHLGVVGQGLEPPVSFSKGILSQSLLAAGVTPELANRLARLTERQLRRAEDRVISRRDIREQVEALLERELGRDVAMRYRLLQLIRHPPRPLIVLLGGVSGTGKSVLAAELAYRLGITRVISTDSIREVMRATVSPALLPALHASTFNAWEALIPPDEPVPTHPSTPLLLSGFREQVQQVSVGLDAVVRRSIEENMSLVLEGVHLVPGYLAARHGAIIVHLLITLRDAEEHHHHFQARDQQTAAARPLHRYLKYFEEIRAMQSELEALAQRRGVPTLDGFSLDESAERAVSEVMRAVYAQLSEEERRTLLGDEPDLYHLFEGSD